MSVVIVSPEIRIKLAPPIFKAGDWVVVHEPDSDEIVRGTVDNSGSPLAQWFGGKWMRCYIVRYPGSSDIFPEASITKSAAQILVDRFRSDQS